MRRRFGRRRRRDEGASREGGIDAARVERHQLGDRVGQQSTDDQPAGPPGVQQVHLVRLRLGIKCGAERIDHSLDQALRESQGQHRGVENDEAGVGIVGLDRAAGQRRQQDRPNRPHIPAA